MKRLGFLLLMLAIALMLGGNALAEDNQHAKTKCSNETFEGDYGLTVNGTINLGGLQTGFLAPLYIQGIQLIHADGDGHLTMSESLMINGIPLTQFAGAPEAAGPPPGYFSEHFGTYTLNSNCTGTAFLTNVGVSGYPENTNFIYLAILMDKKGRQVRMVGVPPFDSGGILRTVTSEGEKVE